MDILPPNEIPHTFVQLSPEKSESSPTPEIIVQTAPQVAALLTKFWPQVTKKNGESVAHYAITGSLGLALLANSTEFQDGEKSHTVPASARKELLGAVHLIHDLDFIRQNPPWPDSFDPQANNFIDLVKLIPAVKSTERYFEPLHIYTPERFIMIKTSTGDHLIVPPDSAAAYKLLSVLSSNNFLNKPYQLNNETPRLIKAATNIYSEDKVWERVREIFQSYDRYAKDNLSEFERISYMLNRVMRDPCISTEVKALLNKAADISGMA